MTYHNFRWTKRGVKDDGRIWSILVNLSTRVHIEKEEGEYTWAWRKAMFIETGTLDRNVKINRSTDIPK